jgi:hypothetical protein
MPAVNPASPARIIDSPADAASTSASDPAPREAAARARPGQQQFPELAPRQPASNLIDGIPIPPRNRTLPPFKVERAVPALAALDLAMPKPELRLHGSALAAPRLDKVILDSADLDPVEANSATEGASTQASQFRADPEGKRYRLKFNAGRPQVTFHEIFAGQLLNAMGFSHAPKATLVSDAAGKLGEAPEVVWIASPELKGFQDTGTFLVKSGENCVEAALQANYQLHLQTYHQAKGDAAKQLERPEVAALLARYKKGGFDKLTPQEHTVLQPLRDCYRRALHAQDKMYDLLPPEFHRQLLHAFYTSEIIGNWDFMNHERANTGFTVENGKVVVHTVDYGNSGPIGFGGKFKEQSGAAANQAARIDEPYAQIPDNLAPGGYTQDNLGTRGSPESHFGERDLSFTTVSDTFGQIGQIPRTAVLGHMLAPALAAELGRGIPGEPRATPPDAALEVAWQLAQLPRGHIKQFAAQMYAQGLAHPDSAVRDLFSSKTTGFADTDALADAYQQRIDGIVARAMQDGHLQRWAERNPERATEISQHVAHSVLGTRIGTGIGADTGIESLKRKREPGDIGAPTATTATTS